MTKSKEGSFKNVHLCDDDKEEEGRRSFCETKEKMEKYIDQKDYVIFEIDGEDPTKKSFVPFCETKTKTEQQKELISTDVKVDPNQFSVFNVFYKLLA